MCENCEKNKEENWAEIRDLLNFNRKVRGPLSERLAERVEGVRNDPEAPNEATLAQIVESIRAQMIADRCVRIARSCPGTEFHGAPEHVIMGAWAGELMKEEIAERLSAGGGLLGLLLGGMIPGFGAEDEDNA